MKVVIKYYDSESLTKEEIIARARQNYGDDVDVEVYPLSTDPWNLINFALHNLITYEQLTLIHDNPDRYHVLLQHLKDRLLGELASEVNRVVKDNELRAS